MSASTNDAALIAAWNRYRVARATLSVLPHEGPFNQERNDTVLVCEQYDIIDPAEKEIAAATPTTVRGVEIKLWFALAQNINQSEVDILCAIREDYRHFEGDGHELDWCDRVVFSAIQGIRAMSEGRPDGAWNRLRRPRCSVSVAATRSTWDVIKTCLVPDIRFSRSANLMPSVDDLDEADCWQIKVEWLSLYLSVWGGRMRPARTGSGQ